MERDIDFKKMFWKIIEEWRKLLICVLLGAVVLGGGKYIRDKRIVETADDIPVKTVEQLKEAMTDEQLQAVQNAVALSNKIKQVEEYQENSVLFRINPYKKNIVVLQYYVNTDYKISLTGTISKDITQDITDAYLTYVNNGGIGNELESPEDSCYVNELISAQSLEDSQTGIFVIQVAGETGEDAEKLADEVDNTLSKYYHTVLEKMGSHEIMLVDRYSSIVTDTVLNDIQKTFLTTGKEAQTELDVLTAAFTGEQRTVWNAERDGEESEEEVLSQTAARFSKRYIVLGGILGAFFCAVFIAGAYILSQRIKDAREPEDIFNLRLLGAVPKNSGRKKRLFGAVDSWIDSLQKKNLCSEDEAWGFLMANIKTVCRKEQIQKLFLASSIVLTDGEKTAVEKIKKELKKEGVTLEFGEAVNRNTASYMQLLETGNVILVEKANMTRYTDIETELKVCKEQDVNVLGIVVFE